MKIKVINNRANRLYLLFILIFLGFMGYFLHERVYLPHKFKKAFYDSMRNDPNKKNVSDEKIWNCSDCLYDNWKEYYGDVRNFPKKEEYTLIDVKIIYYCAAKHILAKKRVNSTLHTWTHWLMRILLKNNKMKYRRKIEGLRKYPGLHPGLKIYWLLVIGGGLS